MSHRTLRRPSRCAASALLVVALLATAVPVAAVAAEPMYRPPVEAPVHDPFRAPEHAYGPGNRGIEYDSAPGNQVLAAADGRVTFAGWVAGSLHVTVLHADGVRTTVSYLAETGVVVGQEVLQGDVLGTAAGRVHFGARRGDAYFDPATLFGEGPVRVHLVPFDVPPGVGVGGERSAISQLLGADGLVVGAVGAGLAVAGTVAGSAAEAGLDTLRLAVHYAPHLVPVVRAATLLRTGFDVARVAWERYRRPCTAEDQPVPESGRRLALLVAGFGSTSEPASIDDLDVDALGYAPADVLRFSYAGGRIPDPDIVLPGVPVEAYEAEHSHQDLRTSAAALADLVEGVAEARPGVPIDLLAHSQGGVVARLALVELEDRHGHAWLDRVGLLATIGTPHQGADLATAGVAVGGSAPGRLALEGIDLLGADTDAPSMAQLAETSDVIRELADHPVPAGLQAVSIAARGDLTVPASRTDVDGAPEAVVPLVGLSAHAELPGHGRTTREVALARAGLPPACIGLDEALADQLVGEAIGFGEDAIASRLWTGSGAAAVPGLLAP